MTARQIYATARNERAARIVIVKTPYRVSFFGGGTDYARFSERHGGAVLSTTIDKFCWHTVRWLPPFFEHKSRIVWSEIELVKNVPEIHHPSVRECLTFAGVNGGVEIHHDGDLPARSGVGSSSAFVVGLLHGLVALRGGMPSKRQLAEDAIRVERDLVGTEVGSQDQVAVAFGGLNVIEFPQEGGFRVCPVVVPDRRARDLESHVMLFYSGQQRTASDVAKEQSRRLAENEPALLLMKSMVQDAVAFLHNEHGLEDFGWLLDEAWKLKRKLASGVATEAIDAIYERSRANGALGGKVVGAGGGGFFLLFVPPDRQAAVRRALAGVLEVPVKFERRGSDIVYYEPGEIASREEVGERGASPLPPHYTDACSL